MLYHRRSDPSDPTDGPTERTRLPRLMHPTVSPHPCLCEDLHRCVFRTPLRAVLALIWLLAAIGCAGPPRTGSTLAFRESSTVHLAGVINERYLQRHGALTSAAQLEAPVALAVGPGGTLVIADRETGSILKVDSRGRLLADAPFSAPRGVSVTSAPRFIAVDMTGNVYISDAENPWISIYDAHLRPVSELEPPYDALGLPLGSISGLTFGSYGEFYVADQFNGRVYRFDASGRFMQDLNEEGTPWERLLRPQGIACADVDGSVFVCEPGNSQVVVYDNQGIRSNAFGGSELKEPVAVALNQHGQCFVADSAAGAIVVFAVDGRFLTRLDGPRLGLEDFAAPTDLAIRDSTLYVADPSHGRIIQVRFRAADHPR